MTLDRGFTTRGQGSLLILGIFRASLHGKGFFYCANVADFIAFYKIVCYNHNEYISSHKAAGAHALPHADMKPQNRIAREITMLKITVCIGSSCHIKGSRQVVEQLPKLIAEHSLQEKVELSGTFCLGQCQSGVCVTVNDEFHSVSPETVPAFFANEVLAKV